MDKPSSIGAFGASLTSDMPEVDSSIRFGEVIENNDPNGAMRIKVFVKGIDDIKPKEDIPWSHPIQSKLYHVIPKIGEAVMVFVTDDTKPNSARYWSGPILSQFQKFKKELYKGSAFNLSFQGIEEGAQSIYDISTAEGVFPDVEDVAILGRDNSDLIFKERTFKLRAGKHQLNNPTVANTKNPAFIEGIITNNENPETFINIYGQYINLISSQGSPVITPNTEALINNRTFESLHPLVYGDELVKLLRLFIQAFLEHVHGYSTNPPDRANSITTLTNFDLNKILSKNVRTN